MTIKTGNQIATVVCERYCKYPGLTSGEEQLAEICASCAFIEALLDEVNRQAGERSNYARLAGTPERLAAFLMRQGNADLSQHWCRDKSCKERMDDEDFDCTDERLRACILRCLMEDAEERSC